MYGKSVINQINKNEAPSEPLAVIKDVAICSLSSVPFLGKCPKGYAPSGAPLNVSVEPSAVAPNALADARKWIRETAAGFVAFTAKGAVNGTLQAFEKLPA